MLSQTNTDLVESGFVPSSGAEVLDFARDRRKMLRQRGKVVPQAIVDPVETERQEARKRRNVLKRTESDAVRQLMCQVRSQGVLLQGLREEIESLRARFGDEELSGFHLPTPTLREIACRVCALHGVKLRDLKSHRRTQRVTVPRHHFCYLARNHTTHSTTAIGRFLGNRDHTTVMHSLKRWEKIKRERKGK